MANKKLSGLTELAETPASGDMVPVVDVSDTTGAATGTTKKVSVTNLLASKQDTITGGATTIDTEDLTASRALESNSSGKVAASSVTATELGYVSGVTSAIQTQVDAKAASSHTHDPSTDLSAAVPYTKGGTGLTAVGTSGQVLKTNSAEDGVEWGDDSGGGGGGGSLDNVSEDTTPQLGGDLDVNSNSIVSASDGNIAITPNGSGKVVLDGLSWPIADGDASQVLKTDGGGNLSFVAGGEANQNAWSTITVPAGTTSQAADTATDSVAFTAAGGMTITGGADDTIEFSSANTNQLTTFDIGVDTNTNATTIAHGETLTLTGGANVTTETTADGTVTIAATDTNTTYTAGDGLTLTGTDFDLSVSELTDISGTGDVSGWSAGDTVAIVDSSDSNASKRIKLPAEIGIACSDETTAITTTGDKATLMVPRGMRITEVKASVTVAETSNTVIANVKYHATDPTSTATIFSTSTGCTIATSAYKNNRVLFTDGLGGSQAYYDVAEDGFIVVSVEATAPTDAKGLKIWLLGYWS